MTTDAHLIFETLAALARPDDARIPAVVAARRDDGLVLLLQILAMKANRHREESRQQNDSMFVTAQLQLSPDYTILTTADPILHFLQPAGVSFVGQPFEALVSAFSKRDWAQFVTVATPGTRTLLLLLTDGSQHIYAVACRMTTAVSGDCNCTIAFMNPAMQAPEIARHYYRIFTEALGIYYKDAHLLQQVGDFLLAHLDRPKPTDKQLARQFYTNRQKLKELFRYVVGCSMYKWYMRKKLEATMALIRSTHLPLHEIAGLYGFVDLWYYNSLFEKAFGIKPSAVKRPL